MYRGGGFVWQGDRVQHAIDVIYATYGDRVSVKAKNKDLRKWGENLTLGTSPSTVMTLAGSEVQETFASTNAITTVVSDSTSDTQNIALYEGHTLAASSLTFFQDTTATALNGRTAVTINTPACRVNRARLASPAAGNIYFYEGGATTNGVPNDSTKVHLIIPAGEIQSQKASTAVSGVDYWLITGATAGVLSKTAAWAQFRLEIKPFQSTYFYPITEWAQSGCWRW